MANPSLDSDDDKPLDPALVRVQARLRRLMLISGATLALGILAVFAAILYRIVAEDASAGRAPPVGVAASLSAAALGLPAGAALVSTAVDGNRLVLTYSHPGGHTLLFIDVTRMAVTGRLELADK